MQSPEHHILLNRDEFVDTCIRLGFADKPAGKLANSLIRTGIHGFYKDTVGYNPIDHAEDESKNNNDQPDYSDFGDQMTDELPVDGFKQLFEWLTGGPADDERQEYIEDYLAHAETEPNMLRHRTSTDIAYRELNRSGVEEDVISLPNLAANISHIQEIEGLGPRSVEMCREVLHELSITTDVEP